MKSVGFGILGCGWVAEEHIKAVLNDGRAEVKALVGRRQESAEKYREQYGLDCTVGTDYAQMLAQDDVDVVVVATPHDQHVDQVVATAEAGKNILIEKPVAITLDGLRREQKAVQAAGVKTLVGFVLHWNPLLATVDRIVESGNLGNIFLVEVNYLHRIWGVDKWLHRKKEAGTSMLAAGCHAVDAMRWFARSEATEVTAYQVQTENPIEYPGTIMANVKFEDGKLGRVISCFDARMPYRFDIGVYGTEGALRNDQLFAPKMFPGQNNFIKIPCILPDSGDVAHHPFQGEISHFIDCILEDKRPFPDLEDAAKTHEICFAADLSAEESRPVAISEL